MTLNVTRVKHYLQQFDLSKLFTEELGWDHYNAWCEMAACYRATRSAKASGGRPNC